MKPFLIILLLLLVVVLESASASLFDFLEVSPNLVLSLVLSLVLLKDFRQVWRYLLVIGLLADFFSGLPFGLISLSLVITGYSVSLLNRTTFSAVSFWVIAGFAFLGTFFYNFLQIFFYRLFFSPISVGLNYLLLESFYNFLIILIFFHGLKKRL